MRAADLDLRTAEAVRLRRELSAEMSDGEIAAAQRAARAWLNSAEHKIEQRAAA